MFHDRDLTPELVEWKDTIRQVAVDSGLDFFEVLFEMVDYDEMNMIAAYGGFPVRYPHWRWGMQFEELQKQYSYGMAKIYELVINNDPCYAYLMRCNPLVDQKLVMSHVYGHSDFFKNNAWFGKGLDESDWTFARLIRELSKKYFIFNLSAFIPFIQY